MQLEFRVIMREFARADQFLMGNRDLIKFAFQMRFPETQEFLEHREARRQIELLPDVGLQQGRVIGHVVENFRRGETVIMKLPDQVCHATPYANAMPRGQKRVSDPLVLTNMNKKYKK